MKVVSDCGKLLFLQDQDALIESRIKHYQAKSHPWRIRNS